MFHFRVSSLKWISRHDPASTCQVSRGRGQTHLDDFPHPRK